MGQLSLIQVFEKPICGYWDGGAKKEFEWRIEWHAHGIDKKGTFVRVGSWDANHWFNVAIGGTEKQTLGNARRKLSRAAKRQGLKCTFNYRRT